VAISDSVARCALAEILISGDLKGRTQRPPSYANENDALHRLVRCLPRPPLDILNELLAIGNELCGSGTAGISFLETQADGVQVFRWIALSGKLSQHLGGCTPRNHSPCGVTVDAGQPQLFYDPGRYFEYFREIDTPMFEALVLPITTGAGVSLGAIWIVSHSKDVRFDMEDVRIMTSLAAVAAFACMRVLREKAGEGRGPVGLS
jgi:hypothetical protein